MDINHVGKSVFIYSLVSITYVRFLGCKNEKKKKWEERENKKNQNQTKKLNTKNNVFSKYIICK